MSFHTPKYRSNPHEPRIRDLVWVGIILLGLVWLLMAAYIDKQPPLLNF